MGQAISEVLPFGIGVAISPIPIVAVILMLFSTRARTNGPAFLVGWILGLGVLSGVVYVLTVASDAGTDPDSSDTISWIKIGLGAVLILLASRRWRSRPAPGATPTLPQWMSGIDAVTPPKAFALAVLLGSINPKNLVLAVGAAAGVGQLGVSTGDAVVALAVFVVLASVSIAGPVAYYLIGGERAKASLDELKAWLTLHNRAVMAVLLLVFGVLLIAKGLAPLTA